MSDLSNAPFQPIQQPPLSSLSQGNLPTFDAFSLSGGVGAEGGSVSSQLGNILAYPTDTPKYIMTFSIQQYNRADFNTVGTFVPSGYPGIALPLPEQLVDVSEGKWDDEDSGLLSLAASGAASSATAARIGTVAATALQAKGGVVPNQFQVVLYRGPKYKKYGFSWKLSPQNFQEADILRMICLTFKNALAPTLISTTGAIPLVGQILWGFPNVFRIRLYPNSKWLYKFKPAVCTNFTVNYTPENRASFYRAVNGENVSNPPESITIQASFLEMEYWVAGNYSNLDDPDDIDLNAITRPLTDYAANAAPIIPAPGGGSVRTI